MICYNQVYEYLDKAEKNRIRIIHIEGGNAYFVNLHGDTAMPKIAAITTLEDELLGGALLLIPDPYLNSYLDENLTNAQIKKRDDNWRIVSKYWDECKIELLSTDQREDLFNGIAIKTGLNELKIKRAFTRFWQRGLSKNALLPDYNFSGGKGKERDLTGPKTGRPRKFNLLDDGSNGFNITDDVKKQFKHIIKSQFQKNNQISLTETYNYLLKTYYSDIYLEKNEKKYRVWDASRIPTFGQFYYWYKKNEDPQLDIISRKSIKEYELKHRPLLSNSTSETDGPGTRFQIDATIADIYLVSSYDRNLIIGRPIVYAVIDVYSRLMTGIYVGLEGPSWVGAMMALDNMATNKVKYCQQFGISISEREWPANHLPEIIIADRGEFEGYSVENLINNLNIKIENTSAYRGDLKGIVERQFRTINTKIKHKTPGAIQKEYRKRGDQDYRLDAKLNLKEFTKIIIHIVLQHNQKIIEKYPLEKSMILDGLIATPLNLWNWGIANKKGCLQLISNQNVFRLNVLPKGKARITRAGIVFKKLFYGSEKAIAEQWYLKLKNSSIEVVYDPRDVKQIYIPHADGKSYDTCYLLSINDQYKDDALEEIQFYQEMIQELKSFEKTEQLENSINTDAAIEEIVKKASYEKRRDDIDNISKTEKLKNIRINRQAEKSLNRKVEKFDLTPEIEQTEHKVFNFETKLEINNKNDQNKNSRLMKKLKKKRDEEFGKE